MKNFIKRAGIVAVLLVIIGTGIIASSASEKYRNFWSVNIPLQ